MKRNPITRNSPLQKSRFKKIGAVVTILALLWLLFAPQSGFFALMKKRSAVKKLQAETTAIAQENRRLAAEVERLENDRQYLEEVARRDYHMLKPNERVYDFSQPAQSGKK